MDAPIPTSLHKYLLSVLEKYGFVEFPHLAVRDKACGEWFRCDHLIKAHLEQIKANKDKKDDVKARCDEVLGKKYTLRNMILKYPK